jgi:Uma2 family endonuclease
MKLPDPIIVVEVLSPTSVHMDTSAKLIGYFKLPSVRHYLVIDPDVRTVTHHARGADDQMSAQTLSAGTLRLDPPGIEIDVAELFG